MKRLLVFCAAAAFMTVSNNIAQAANWLIPDDFTTIQEAIDSPDVEDGDTIIVSPGNYFGAFIDKAVEIKGEEGAVIDGGPLLTTYKPCGTNVLDIGFFFAGGGAGSGATISHLKFDGPAFPVFSRGADDVTVTQCTMVNSIQGITNWSGNAWEITHNVITDLRAANGGGIGILVGVPQVVQGMVSDNRVSHNKISGTLHVSSCDLGGYSGTGIVLFADFRNGALGPKEVMKTRVVKNDISLVSDNPDVVDVVAIELTEHGTIEAGWPATPPDPHAIHDNVIGFNDLRGTVWQIALSPENLDEVNDISRNLGENRGQGLHPSVF
jgi:hypothetical protein